MNKKHRKILFIFLISVFINSLFGTEIPYKKGMSTDTLFKEFGNLQHAKEDKYYVLNKNNNLEQIVFWIDNDVGVYYVKEISQYYTEKEIYSEFQNKKLNLQKTYGTPEIEKDESVLWRFQNNDIEYIWIFIQAYNGKEFRIMMEVQFNNKELLP